MKKLGELLKEAGVLDEMGLQRALSQQRSTRKRLGDTLLDLKLVTEDQLFDTLARQLEIPIIAEPKLLMVEVQKVVIDMVPARIAWDLMVLPLLIGPDRKQIAIVTAEPNDVRIAAGIRSVTGIASVKPYLAKRSALKKAIQKYYGPPPTGGVSDEELGELILEEENVNIEAPTSLSIPRPPLKPPAREPSVKPVSVSTGVPPAIPGSSGAMQKPPQTETTGTLRARAGAKQKIIRNVIVADSNKAVANAVKRSLEMERYTVEIATSAEEILSLVKGKPFDLVVVKGAIAENIGELERRVRAVFPMIEFRVVPSFAQALMGDPVTYNRLADFTFDTFDLLLALVERGDATTRKRAQLNARYSKLVAQKLQLPRKAIDEVFFAAYLDALGDVLVKQRGGDPGDRAQARNLSIELFRSINPPYDIETVLSAVDERFDGSGPRGIKGEQIPIGARILAVVLGYNDAKGMPREQLQKFLREMSGRLYDFRIVETFLQILRSEALLGDAGGKLESLGHVLIVDKDMTHTSTLELRLANEGYKVTVASDGQQALEIARANPPTLILSEIALPKLDGFNLCTTLKSDNRTNHVPFVFVSGKNDEFNSTKAFDMGADDFIGKPVNIEFLLKKLGRFLAKPKPAAPSSSGVQGRLSDFGLIELVQTLSLGMKTVKLELSSEALGQAAIYIEDGRIVHSSTVEKQGDEAFYQIATWDDGAFQILSGQTTTDRNVGSSNDFLILEALRRMDEAEAGISQEGKEASVVKK